MSYHYRCFITDIFVVIGLEDVHSARELIWWIGGAVEALELDYIYHYTCMVREREREPHLQAGRIIEYICRVFL
jgi:hypothetical protein